MDEVQRITRWPSALIAICRTRRLPKLIAKAENGCNHSKAFTLQNFHEPIMITPRNAGSSRTIA